MLRLGEHFEVIVTIHPSYVLRLRDEAREAELLHFVDDLRLVSDVAPEARTHNGNPPSW